MVRVLVAVLLAGAMGVFAVAGGVRAQPQAPATYYGTASIDGKPAPEGAEVRGLIDGQDCTQPGARGVVIDGGVAVYVITVMHESQSPGCGADGKQVSFTIGGKQAGQTVAWRQGLEEVNLNSGSGKPMALSSALSTPAGGASAAAATATEAARFTPKSGAIPTDAVTFGKTQSPGQQQDPSKTKDGGGGGAMVAVVLIVLAVLAVGGGAAGVALSRRK